MTRRMRLGFDRKIHVEWLDATAARVAWGAPDAEVRRYLTALLEGELGHTGRRGALGKTVTVLSHIWSRVPSECVAVRNHALNLLPRVASPDRLALHWALAIATYPFFTDVAIASGRLLALQGDVSLAAITRRLTAQWGDRSTMARAVQRVVRSMAQWGALVDAGSRGTYRRTATVRRADGPLAELLVEALLIDSRGRSLLLTHLENHPALFPFAVRLNANQLRGCGWFSLHRQGLDTDLVELARPEGTR